LACHNYHDHYGEFPPAYVADADGRPMHSWRVLILEFIEQRELYKQYDFSEPWDGPNNRKLIDQMPRLYVFPGDEAEGATETNYLAVVGAETVWPHDQSTRFDDVTNRGQTIMCIENRGSGIVWTEPRDLAFESMSFSLADDPPNGISSKFDRPAIAAVDGKVLRLERDLPAATVRSMLTRSPDDDVNDPGVVELPGGRNMDQTEQEGRRESSQ
jgi:hypothetical protein